MRSCLRLSPNPRSRLYLGLACLGAAGGAWLTMRCVSAGAFTVCPFKLVCGVPCPACGSTSAVLAIFEGDNPLKYNPLGLLTVGLMAVSLAALVKDILLGSDGLYRTWCRSELLLRQPAVASLAVVVVVVNWLWTISKGL